VGDAQPRRAGRRRSPSSRIGSAAATPAAPRSTFDSSLSNAARSLADNSASTARSILRIPGSNWSAIALPSSLIARHRHGSILVTLFDPSLIDQMSTPSNTTSYGAVAPVGNATLTAVPLDTSMRDSAEML